MGSGGASSHDLIGDVGEAVSDGGGIQAYPLSMTRAATSSAGWKLMSVMLQSIQTVPVWSSSMTSSCRQQLAGWRSVWGRENKVANLPSIVIDYVVERVVKRDVKIRSKERTQVTDRTMSRIERNRWWLLRSCGVVDDRTVGQRGWWFGRLIKGKAGSWHL